MTQPLPTSRRVSLRLLAFPAWFWVGAIVAVSFAVRAWLARGMEAPFILVDELIYSELARSFAESGEFLVRDEASGVYGVLYPLLISPAYLVFDRLPDAYAAVKTINSLVMSLAAVPAYALARRVLSPAWAVGAAAFSVAIPSLAYTATVMTENLFYPLLLGSAWALVLVLERPDGRRVALLFGIVAAAFATRAQALALLPAIATAPLVLAALRGRGLRELRSFAPLYAALAGLGVVAVVVQAVRGRSPLDLLGVYSVVGRESYDVGRVLRFWLWHVEELDLYLGVVPVIALLVLLGNGRRLPSATQAFLAATVALVFWMSLVVGAFASRFADRIEERDLFHVAPLVLIALLVWIERGAPRPRLATGAAVASSVGLPLLFPYGRFLASDVVSDTLALIALRSESLLFDSATWTVAVGGLAVAALFVLVPARYAVAVPLVVLAYFVAVDRSAWGGPRGFEQAGAGALRTGIGEVRRDWIDRAVPPSETVTAIWTGRLDQLTINENEFFNRSVGRVYYTGTPTPGGLPERPVTIGADGTVHGPPAGGYVLVDGTGTLEPNGTRLARDAVTGMALWRVRARLATVASVRGLYPGGTWSGKTVVYERRHCAARTLHVALASDPTLFSEPTTVTAASGSTRKSVRFGPEGGAALRIPLQAGGRCLVRFTVSPTAVPRQLVPGSTDARKLGAHFRAFWVE